MIFGLLIIISVINHASAQDVFNKARAALNAGDTTAAITGFTDAIKAGQKSAEANYHLGTIAFARGRFDDAISFLQNSVRIDDDNVQAFLTLGYAQIRKGDAMGALATFRQAAKLAPKDCMVSIAYGRALLAADSTDAAVVHLTKAKECAPEDASVYEALGDAYQKQSVLVLAITNYQKAVELSPKNIQTRYTLARALEKNRQYTDAVKQYDEVIANDSTYADAYLQKGSILVRAKLYVRALEPLRKFIQIRPDLYDAKAMLAKAAFEAKRYDEAVTVSSGALLIDSSSAEVWRTNFYALVETKDFARAEVALAGLQRRTALDVQDYLKLGDLYFGLKKWDDALNWYLKAVAADSANCDPYFNLGFLYMQQQKWGEAAFNFEKRITCDSNSLSAYINAAASHMQLKNFPVARTLLTKAISLKSDFFQGRLWLARYYVQVDSFDNAKAEYEQVLSLIGDQTDKYKREAGEAHALLASLYVSRKEYTKAIDSFAKALRVGYENSGMHLSWGQSILQTLDPKDPADESKRKNDDAVRHFRKSVEMDANNCQGHLWLAEGLVRSRVAGDDEANKKLKDEACSEYRKALKCDPKLDDAKKAMERIGC
ncbi:MAG: tetratricopeptide repeat protein [Bacteroidota bacterium]